MKKHINASKQQLQDAKIKIRFVRNRDPRQHLGSQRVHAAQRSDPTNGQNENLQSQADDHNDEK